MWLVLAACVALLALPPRLVALDRYVTTDELFWTARGARFAEGLLTGQPAATYQSGHPGVITMWVETLWVGPRRLALLAGSRSDVSRREVSGHPEFLGILSEARRGVGITTALLIGAVCATAIRLMGPSPGVLGGLMLALDPFLLGHSRVVHIDALLALCMTLAGLLALLGLRSGGGHSAMVAAGAATASALLCKAPSLLLIAWVPVGALTDGGLVALRSRATFMRLAIWAAASVASYVVLWPAVWQAPLGTVGRVLRFVGDNAGGEHAAGVVSSLGAAYYPMVLLARSTPLTLIGLVCLALTWRRCGRSTVWWLAGLAFTFLLAMTVAAKEADRYALPAFPPLDLLAGLGLWRMARLVPLSATARTAGFSAVVVLLQCGAIGGSWPYGTNALSPLLAGVPAAVRLASGWGEGLDGVAAFLNAQPNAARLKVAMPDEIYTTVLDPQFRGQVMPAEGSDAAAYDFLVVYVRSLIVAPRPDFLAEQYLAWTPVAEVNVLGTEMARVYRTSTGAPISTRFGDRVELVGYGLESASLRQGRNLGLRMHWRPLSAGAEGTVLQVGLRGQAGDSGWLAVPLAADAESIPGVWLCRCGVQVPASLPPGQYRLELRVMGADAAPLPTAGPQHPGPAQPRDGRAVVLRDVTVR
ncbi:MAG: hypothetical protein U0821_06455 [Chloroflexota bacterium]